MRGVGKHDEAGDAATNPTAAPFPDPNPGTPSVPVAPSAAGFPFGTPQFSAAHQAVAYAGRPAWTRSEPPEDAKEARQWVQAVVDGHPPGLPFFHPGLGRNVIKSPQQGPAGGTVLVDVQDPRPVDPQAWYANGCFGPAPVATAERVEEMASVRAEHEAGKPHLKSWRKKSDEKSDEKKD